MKRQIISYADRHINSSDKGEKKFARILKKNINNFKCYNCLDTNKCWKYRGNYVFARMDGHGDYDVVRCNYCNDGSWLSTSHSNDLYENNIRIFQEDLVTESDIISELKKYYHNQIIADDPTWILAKSKDFNIHSVSSEINLNLNNLSNIVFSAINVYAGNLMGLANMAKDLTLNIGMSFTKETDVENVIRKIKTDDGKDGYLILKLNKSIKNRNLVSGMIKSKKFIFELNYLILIPDNDAAKEECQEIISDNVEDIINKYSKQYKNN